jgi:hypothetical protein
MKQRRQMIVRRRDLLSLVLVSAGAAVTNAAAVESAAAKSVDLRDKRKARYQPNSAEVRNFYRVNSYPTR